MTMKLKHLTERGGQKATLKSLVGTAQASEPISTTARNWSRPYTCGQCGKRLSQKDRALGTICSRCVQSNRQRIYANETGD